MAWLFSLFLRLLFCYSDAWENEAWFWFSLKRLHKEIWISKGSHQGNRPYCYKGHSCPKSECHFIFINAIKGLLVIHESCDNKCQTFTLRNALKLCTEGLNIPNNSSINDLPCCFRTKSAATCSGNTRVPQLSIPKAILADFVRKQQSF